MKIATSARIHPQLILGTCEISIGENTLLRPFNIIRNVDLEIGSNAIIGSWNWFSSAPALSVLESFRGSLRLGNHSDINSRHYFDCSGGIVVGNYSCIAGVRSTFITHFVDTKESLQSCKAIQIDDFVMLSSNVSITPGAHIREKSLVAMGSVITAQVFPQNVFIAGVPGIVKGPISGKFFSRKTGKILAKESNADE
jgi:acetyltransferase-like isoleucine patch superfamily enzyme